MTSITPVIMCGGSETKVRPKSRNLLPRILLSLTGEQTVLQLLGVSMIRAAVARASKLSASPLVQALASLFKCNTIVQNIGLWCLAPQSSHERRSK